MDLYGSFRSLVIFPNGILFRIPSKNLNQTFWHNDGEEYLEIPRQLRIYFSAMFIFAVHGVYLPRRRTELLILLLPVLFGMVISFPILFVLRFRFPFFAPYLCVLAVRHGPLRQETGQKESIRGKTDLQSAKRRIYFSL